jgi:hypothetical protein
MTDVRFGLLDYPGIANLGDTIQALAARRFLPRVDVPLARERLSDASVVQPGDRVRAILNGWFMHDARHWPPAPGIEPLLISMHFAEGGPSRLRRWARRPIDRMLSGAGRAFLERWGPVGARDLFTLEQLERRGIPAYHSGCLTLTLPVPRDVVPSETVIACDLPPAALARLRASCPRPVRAVTHLGAEHLDRPARAATAAALLRDYAGAAALVTTRIHAGLPCLAFGTPVLLLHEAMPPRRVKDQIGLFHAAPLDRFVAGQDGFDWRDPPANPGRAAALVPDLVERCEAFVARSRSA